MWCWTTSSWVQLESRTVDATEILVADLVPIGAPADYVKGTSGNGAVRVQIHCTTSSGTFFASGNLLRIGYNRP